MNKKNMLFKKCILAVCMLVLMQSPASALTIQIPPCSSPAGLALRAAAATGFGWLGMNYSYRPAFFQDKNPAVRKSDSLILPARKEHICKPGTINKTLCLATAPFRGALFGAECALRIALCSIATAGFVSIIASLGTLSWLAGEGWQDPFRIRF